MKSIKFQNWILMMSGLLVVIACVVFVYAVLGRFTDATRIYAGEKFALMSGNLSQQVSAELRYAASRDAAAGLPSGAVLDIFKRSGASANAWLGLIDDEAKIVVAHVNSSENPMADLLPGSSLKGLAVARFGALEELIGRSAPLASDLLNLGSARYLVSLQGAGTLAGKPFRVLALTPEADFTELVAETQQFVLIISGLLLLLLVPMAIKGTRGIVHALTDMTRDAERLRKLGFASAPTPVHSHLQEINELAQAQANTYQSIRERTEELESAKAKLGQIVETGVELGREKDNEALLRRALFGVRDVAHCEAATLFLKTDRRTLRFAVRTSDDELPAFELPLFDENGEPQHRFVATHVALTGETVVIDDVYHETRFDLSGTKKFSEESGMRVVSMLNVPLMPQKGKIIGTIQLMNARDPSTGEVVAFDAELVQFVEALAGLSAIALENKSLLDAQAALMDSMIQIMAGAIDTKSPYTGGHCERVPELATMLAEEACRVETGSLADFSFKNEDEWREFRIGAWLHDYGKVTTPEYVVDKATKLETIFNRIHEIRTRFEVLLRDADIERLRAIHEHGEDAEAATARFESRRSQLIDDFAFIAECNKGAEFMAPEKVARVKGIAEQTWLRHFDDRIGVSQDELRRMEREAAVELPATERLLADKPHHQIRRPSSEALDARHGFSLRIPEYLYDRGEVHNLSVERGTLTAEERFKINEHIIQTIVMLESMPLPSNLKRVPEYAGTHHETLTGSGYPRSLKAKELSVPSRIMAIADIFEALTASDRPYKETKKLSECIQILSMFKKNQHIDPELFDLFLSSGVYKRYAEKFMLPEQIDDVQVEQYLA